MQDRLGLAIRVDAEPEIGLGHLRRCLTLGKQLEKDGFTVYILTHGDIRSELLQGFVNIPLSKADSPISEAYQNHELKDAELTLRAIQDLSVKLVIVDSYRLGNIWEETVAMKGYKILAIDDFRDRRHQADILLSDIDIPFQKELLSSKPNAYQLVGLKYALIDSEFIATKLQKNYCQSANQKKEILISYGGSDLTGETVKAILAIKMLVEKSSFWKNRISVKVVVGPFNSRLEIIKHIVAGLSFIEILNAPNTLANLFSSANILLIGGGNSMIEGVFMQKVCLVTATSPNQVLGVKYLHQQSAILYLGHQTEVNSEHICNTLLNTLNNYDEIVSQIRQLSLCDHLGASRVSHVIKSVLS
jgi:UDP-2,4-diacetamido-2,4,6-trideoxy-beta-L-altropyranose hydrolase